MSSAWRNIPSWRKPRRSDIARLRRFSAATRISTRLSRQSERAWSTSSRTAAVIVPLPWCPTIGWERVTRRATQADVEAASGTPVLLKDDPALVPLETLPGRAGRGSGNAHGRSDIGARAAARRSATYGDGKQRPAGGTRRWSPLAASANWTSRARRQSPVDIEAASRQRGTHRPLGHGARWGLSAMVRVR